MLRETRMAAPVRCSASFGSNINDVPWYVGSVEEK
jgi:hypothetical protein